MGRRILGVLVMARIALKHHYKDAAPLGIFPICNYGGLAVLHISDDGEQAICAWNFGNGYEGIRRHQIQHTYTGRAYVRKGGRRYYFGQIMRTNGGF